MCVITDGTQLALPGQATLITDNGVSQVWRGNDGYIYKRSTPFLVENELYMLEIMYPTGFVPYAVRYDKYTIKMTDLGYSENVSDKQAFTRDMRRILSELKHAGIRHGDLTKYAIIVIKNRPYVIDFAESRWMSDPRPDKRTEGDEHWLERTIIELTT